MQTCHVGEETRAAAVASDSHVKYWNSKDSSRISEFLRLADKWHPTCFWLVPSLCSFKLKQNVLPASHHVRWPPDLPCCQPPFYVGVGTSRSAYAYDRVRNVSNVHLQHTWHPAWGSRQNPLFKHEWVCPPHFPSLLSLSFLFCLS